MKRLFATLVLVSLLSVTCLLGTASAKHHRASAPATYQVTGPVLELTADMIVVKKGNDRWEIARDASTKVTGDLKVGAIVTIQYRMAAASIDVKAAKMPSTGHRGQKDK